MNLLVKILPKVRSNHCLPMLLAVIFIFALTADASAQGSRGKLRNMSDSGRIANPKPVDTTIRTTDSLLNDSIKIAIADSLLTDSTETDSAAAVSKQSLEERLGIRLSPDALPAEVKTEASDSAVLDMRRNIYYLYGKAKVNYEDMELNAGKIIYDQEKNLVTAAPLSDSVVKLKDRPNFAQGQEKFTYDSLQYNFRSKRAIVRNPKTQYGNGYVFSEQVKRNPDQSIYGYKNLYTTCALDTPHFGIVAKKIKVIPGRVVASGPANIVVEQVPTPLFLPFGLFPISKGQRSGFLLPTYSIEGERGVGLLNGGYYFNLGKYADLETRVSIYSKGSWQASSRANYAKRYKYNGGLALTYAYDKTGEDFEPDASIRRNFNVKWLHTTDQKARPGSQFNASVNAGTSSFNSNNTYDAEQILNNQYRSDIAYTKSWAGKPYSLSVAARHSQEASTGQVNVSLPEAAFFVNPVNIFQGKNGTGTKWYEKITVGYNISAQNQLNFTDSLFNFNKLSLSQFNNAVKHSVPLNATYNVLRFVNLSLSAGYNEYWYSKQTFRAYDYTGDTIAVNTNRGFFAARDYNAGINASTRIYGLKMFKKSKLMGIRHELRPNLSLNYVPDFAKDPYNFGYRTILDPRAKDPVYLSPYEGSLLGAPSQLGNYSSLLGLRFDNNLQIKVRSTKDTNGFKNIKLIDNFSIGTNYNLAADSFNWQPLALSMTTMLFNVINITANANYDLYAFDTALNRRINKTMYEQGTGIARFTNAYVSMSASLRPRTRTDNNPKRNTEEYQRLTMYGINDVYYDFNIPWNLGVSYSLNVNKEYNPVSHKDTVKLTNHNISLNGDFNLTPRWKVVASTNYNLVEKKLQMTQIRIIRDMHCWEMELSVVPFGQNRFYNFTLHVKAQELQDLKLMRRRDYRDAIF